MDTFYAVHTFVLALHLFILCIAIIVLIISQLLMSFLCWLILFMLFYLCYFFFFFISLWGQSDAYIFYISVHSRDSFVSKTFRVEFALLWVTFRGFFMQGVTRIFNFILFCCFYFFCWDGSKTTQSKIIPISKQKIQNENQKHKP